MSKFTTVKVRGYHCDFYGHVNNARFLELMEDARWNWCESAFDLAAWQKAGFGFVVSGIDIRYRRPAPEGMVLRITSEVARLEAKFGVFRQEIHDDATGKLIAEADVTFAVIDKATGRAIPLEGEAALPFVGFRRDQE